MADPLIKKIEELDAHTIISNSDLLMVGVPQGGGLYNLEHITFSNLLPNGIISTERLANYAVTANKIAAGAVTADKLATIPAARVSRGTGVTATPTLAAFPFNSEDLDTDAMYTSGSPTRITFKTAAWFEIGGFLTFTSGGTGYRLGIIVVNGDTTPVVTGQTVNAIANAMMNISFAGLYQFSVNDYIELKVQASESTAINRAAIWARRVF